MVNRGLTETVPRTALVNLLIVAGDIRQPPRLNTYINCGGCPKIPALINVHEKPKKLKT
jgi:hypothetical protein